MKIFIAAAHGGGDPGAVANNTTEAAEVAKIVDEAVKLLKTKCPPQFEIIQVPNEFNLDQEVKFINENSIESPTDICIEVNMNSNAGAPGTGIETFYGEQGLSIRLQEDLVKETGLRDRGVKYGMHLYFNKATNPPSALVELGFINNIGDLNLVRKSGAQALARAVARAIGAPEPAASQPEIPAQPGIAEKKKAIIEHLKAAISQIQDLINLLQS